MKKILPFLIAGLFFSFFQPSTAATEDWQNLKIQSASAYEAHFQPNYFVMGEQYQLDSMVQFRYSGNDSSYQYKVQYRNTINGSQTIREEIQYQWQNGWREKVKNEYTYNGQGELVKSAVYKMDSITAQWQQTIRNTFGYKNGKKDDHVMEQRDSVSHAWKNAFKYEYAYNNNDSVAQKLLYCWNEKAVDWNYYYKYEYSYNNQNCQDSCCQYQWDSVANQWAKQFKFEYQYNVDNKLEKQYQFCYDSVKNQWDSCACHLYEYANEYLYKHEFCTYDSVNNEWDYNWKHEYLYNGEGQIKQLHRYQHSSLKSTATDWVLDTKDFYYYASGVTGVGLAADLVEQQISIYPNPASSQITLEMRDVENCRLQIFDITGRNIYQKSIQAKKTVISLKQFNPGIYFFVIDNGISRKANKVIIQ
ncbi:T9SS type A sorting domain-containing protein [Maribellus sediminis]|uniref:T9SS type A sorting domain-containing protein n=1 Tax=Maribellus sediminis TaxID=2696285 RepID=UPI0014304AD2|nr:T9SS type A sorting domain-containing protein [Maribellus sediminis]